MAERKGRLRAADRAVHSVRRTLALLLRKCLPGALVPRVVAVRARLAGRRPVQVADAEAGIRLVVGPEPPDEEVHELALRYLRRMAWRGETRWHPDWVNQQPVDGLEHLRKALAMDKGCILSFAHHGDWEGTFPSIARHGFTLDALGSSDMFVSRPQPWLRAQKAVVESVPGSSVVDVGGGSPLVRELLDRGRVVAIALDVPGHTAVNLLGHDLMLSSGGTRIAVTNDVPVIVQTSGPDPSKGFEGARVTLSPPLFPHDFASVDELLSEIARRHEEAILAWPEAMDRPRTLMDRRMVREPTEYKPAG